MKKLAIIILTVLAMTSCKPASTRNEIKPDPKATGINGITPPDVRNFGREELIIGDRICKSLRYKREKMMKLTDNVEKFAFTGQWKACNESLVSLAQYGVTISNSLRDLKYIPELATTKSFQDVLTDESEPLRTLCGNIEGGSVTVSNYISLGSSNYFFKLYNNSTYDSFEISKMSKNAKGVYSLVGTQAVSVITSAAPGSETRLLGIEKFRTLNLTCSGSKDFSSLSHTWVKAITDYKLPNE